MQTGSIKEVIVAALMFCKLDSTHREHPEIEAVFNKIKLQ